ncbi:MAG: outer membrane beta-barrel protein [Bacteroidetes bacterium]|nr:outer membrane beta-barrel protein [Bacteroidota bacterium]
MKKLVALTAFLSFLCFSFASAQMQSYDYSAGRNFFIGSGFGFSTATSTVDINSVGTNLDGGTAYQLNLNPGIGYFLTNNFALGLGMELISNETEAPININDPNTTTVESSNLDVLFGPFARIYLPIRHNQSFFLSSTFGFGSSDNSIRSGEEIFEVDNSLTTLGIGPGYTIFAQNGMALETIFRYNYAQSKSEIQLENEVRESKTITHAFDFSIGIRYYFGGLRGVGTGSGGIN